MAKKVRLYKVKRECPYCFLKTTIRIGFIRGHVFEPDEWYAKDDDDSRPSRVEKEAVAKCDHCGKEYYYRLELVPSLAVFRLTQASVANPEIIQEEEV